MVRLNAQQLILLTLGEMKKFLNLFLLSHLSLLLLLLEVVFLQPTPFKLGLLTFVGSEPFSELNVVLAVVSLVDRDHEDCGREEAKYWLA